jgi:hypothetical protein
VFNSGMANGAIGIMEIGGQISPLSIFGTNLK